MSGRVDVKVENFVHEASLVQENGIEVVIDVRSVSTTAASFSGPAGPKGDSAQTEAINFQQAVPAMVWNIQHDLGFKPHVTLFLEVEGQAVESYARVLHPNDFRTTVAFKSPMSGTARLS